MKYNIYVFYKMSVPDGSPPDLVFNWSVAPSQTTVSEIINGNQILITKYGNIYVNENPLEIIGKYASFNNIFDKEDVGSDGSVKQTGYVNYFLSEGSIQIYTSVNLVYNPVTGKYAPLPSETLISPIVTGSGNFLNAAGFVVTLISPTGLNRIVQVYFDK